MSYPYKLPELPYQHDALEPYIDARTMHFHHDAHQLAYINKLNDALEIWPEGQKRDLIAMLSDPESIPQHIRLAIVNNGGGAWIHTMFWHVMSPTSGGGEPTGDLAQAIIKSFGSFSSFKEQFTAAAIKFFGSGWIWLAVAPDGGLNIVSTPGQDLPQVHGFEPLLVLDVWEHAYYLKFQNRRPEYIDNWWHVVNWPYVAQHYNKKL